MDISGSNINQPVGFYSKNTSNMINMAIEGENHLYGSNIFSSGFAMKKNEKAATSPIKKKRKSKRLNTIDSDYLPDETEGVEIKEKSDNFFVGREENSIVSRAKKAFSNIVIGTPLINYFFLKQKKQKIQKTVETLSDINQNVDELMNTSMPYGEQETVYNNIAKNLTDAANIIVKVNKDL